MLANQVFDNIFKIDLIFVLLTGEKSVQDLFTSVECT